MKAVFSQSVRAPHECVREFYGDISNLKSISPPYPRLDIESPDTKVSPGKEFMLSLNFVFFKVRWQSTIEEVVDGQYFTDTYSGNIFRVWKHSHRYQPVQNGTLLTDEVVFEPRWWFVPFARVFVNVLFLFRKKAIGTALA